MYQNILEDLGLSPNEAKIYESLVEKGESSVSEISLHAKIHRRNTYDAIQRLINKGLCFQIFSVSENKYNAVDPDKLKEFLAEKQEKLISVLPMLKKKFGNRLAPEEAYIYRGYEGQKNMWRDMLRVGQDVYIIGAKAQWFDSKLDDAREIFYKEARRLKMNFNLLIDNEVKTKLPDFASTYPAKMKHRYLPKEYSTSAITVIFGDYVVTYAGVGIKKMSENTVLFIIHSTELADGYRKWFQYMWEQSSSK